MYAYLEIHSYTIVAFLAVCILIALGNCLFIRPLRPITPRETPFVSILIPARNEEQNVERCLRSLLAQSYPAFEVIVLDDHSTDETRAILDTIKRDHPELQILGGEPLPEGWLGKHWACHQLAAFAGGELLLFTDADTWHEPTALSASVAAFTATQSDLLTAIPHEQVVTWGEKITIPVLGFAPFSFIPVFLARWPGLSHLAVTIGQFMLFRRDVYDAIGGYEAIRSHPLDDVKFGRRVQRYGYRWTLVDALDQVHCRMYRDFHSSAAGLTRSLFAFFTQHTLLYLFAWSWIGIAFLEPVAVLLCSAAGIRTPFFSTLTASIAVAEALLLFLLIYARFRFPLYLIWFYPVSIAVWVWLAFRSLLYARSGKAGWKGRRLPTSTLKG